VRAVEFEGACWASARHVAVLAAKHFCAVVSALIVPHETKRTNAALGSCKYCCCSCSAWKKLVAIHARWGARDEDGGARNHRHAFQQVLDAPMRDTLCSRHADDFIVPQSSSPFVAALGTAQ
jgi:hypothetical protein